MRILIDIGHPAHVHLFHPLADELRRRGHTLFFSVRDIPVAKRLMLHFGMTPFVDLGVKRRSIVGKAFSVIGQDVRLLHFVLSHHVDVGISSGFALPHVSRLSSMTSFVFDDDDDAVEPLSVRFEHPFSAVVFTPSCISRKSRHAVYYNGTHELAYLHPSRFVPDTSVLERAGLDGNSRFFIMRFVALNAHHDKGQCGLSLSQKQALLDLLLPHGRVIITSERPVEPQFESYRLPVPPEDIHSLMAFCSLFVGDSQTMTSEAAILGVPSFKCNSFAGKLSVPNMLEQQFDLCHAYSPDQFDEMCRHIATLLSEDPITVRHTYASRRKHFLSAMDDPTAFFVKYIEEYEG